MSLGETEQRGRGAADGGEDATSDRASARIPGLDASTRRFGPCAGNTPTEAPVVACEARHPHRRRSVADVRRRGGYRAPDLEGQRAEPLAKALGYAGVYSSLLKHAYRAGERYGVSGAEILMRCGQRKLVGGQEDQILGHRERVGRGALAARLIGQVRVESLLLRSSFGSLKEVAQVPRLQDRVIEEDVALRDL